MAVAAKTFCEIHRIDNLHNSFFFVLFIENVPRNYASIYICANKQTNKQKMGVDLESE